MTGLKEWLNTKTFEYKLAHTMPDGDWLEIPAGAEIAILDDERLSFAKPINGGDDVLVFDFGLDLVWDTTKWDSWAEFIDYGFDVVWQREQNEPFLTPEFTLNDQYAEIEEVRQSAIKVSHNPNQKPKEIRKNSIEGTLAERKTQYGCYEDVAQVTQQILSALRIGNYDKLPAPMKESLHMIASKMARIVNGDPEYFDNWHDIGGYAKLIEKLIKGE